MPPIDDKTVGQFATLFTGYSNAYGTGKGGWIKQEPGFLQYKAHLEGRGDGLGIGPLRTDDTCLFAAIDLDRPDFEVSKEMMKLLPGTSWLERSRSGNAHVLVFFDAPIEAWIVRGIMREATMALGERIVEIFPKSDHLMPGMFGNYLNLPYFGDTRLVIAWKDDEGIKDTPWNLEGFPVNVFTRMAYMNLNNPEDWRKRARWLGIPSPEERQTVGAREFGTSPTLHMCAQYVIENRETHPIVEGHRAVVYFTLSKQLANWSEIDDDEALSLLSLVNDASPDPISSAELNRIYSNVKRGQFTSTGCDDPLFIPYAHPNCKIANS